MPICDPCARAADRQAPRSAHCNDPACTCAHRVERYGEHATTKES